MMSLCSSSSLSSNLIIKSQCSWSDLPENVLFEVLRRLSDSQNLISLKIVSKEWNFVISRLCIPRLCPPYPCAPFWGLVCFEEPLSPEEVPEGLRYFSHNPFTDDKFLKLHFVAVGNYFDVLFRRLGEKKPTIEHHMLSLIPSSEEDRDPSDIRDCCNGLILIQTQSQYYVGNPVTRQRLSIPKSHHYTNNINKTIRSSLVFDPYLCKDPSFPVQFKIVSFIRPPEDATFTYPIEIDIFCSETWEWCTHVLPLEVPYNNNNNNDNNNSNNIYGIDWLRRSVYFKGGLYFLSFAMYLVCIDNIISGPISGVKAWAIALPDRDLYAARICSQQEFYGCIANSSSSFYYSNHHKQASSILVWRLVLKGPNSEWVLTHNISTKDDIVPTILGCGTRRWNQSDLFRPCGFFPNDEAMFIAAPQLIFSYNFKTKRTKEFQAPYMWRCNRKSLHLEGNWIFPFSPCLLLLNSTVTRKYLRH